MARDKNMRITTPDSDGGGSGFKRFVITLVIVTAILYAGAFFGLRTAGARSLIESWLENRTGMEVETGETSLAFPLGVKITALKSGNPGENEPGFVAEELTIKFFTRGGTSIKLRGLELVIAEEADGSWMPRFFSKLGGLPLRHLAAVSDVTKSFRDDFSIELDGGLLKWVTDNGKVYIMMEGVDFSMQPVALPDHEMIHYRLDVFKYSTAGADVGKGHNIVREWLSGKDVDHVDVVYEGDIPGDPDPVGVRTMEITDESQ